MANKQQKVKKYRKPLNINIGMIIFGAVLVYLIVCVVMYFQSSPIVRYEVKEGSLASSNIYRGIALRQELVVPSENAGYINYYAREGERVGKNDLVYIIDETGRFNEELDDSSLGENTLSEKQLAEFRNEIVGFMHDFESTSFENVYDFKYKLNNTVFKLSNTNIMENIDNLGNANTKLVYSPASGIATYWIDGFEALKAEEITETVFDEETYENKYLISNEIIAVGDPAYKLSTSEIWSVVIPVDPARGQEIAEEGYVKVRFLKNQYESWGATNLFHGSDGKTYLELTFTNSMITFATDRFLDVELIMNDETGLKIPNTSIVEKEFFLIDEEYVLESGEYGREGVIRQCFLEDGSISSEFLETDVYSYDRDEKVYYLDASVLNAGDVLYKTDSQETFTVSKRATLIGVYNMNKGYADFKEINILYQNEEYAIVKANTQYGLNVYDYIVLNAESVKDDQFINE